MKFVVTIRYVKKHNLNYNNNFISKMKLVDQAQDNIL